MKFSKTIDLLILIICLSFFSVIAAAQTAAEKANPSTPDYTLPPMKLLKTKIIKYGLLDLTFATPYLVPDTASVRILLPQDYDNSKIDYPVIYLMTIQGGDHSNWTDITGGWPVSLEKFADNKEVIIVMPDNSTKGALPGGWFTDWYNNSSKPKWESFIVTQLIPYINENFRVCHDRNGRVAAGASMGGFGAMSLAARHPDLFAGAFSFSGAIDSYDYGIEYACNGPWGDWSQQEVRTQGHNPTFLAANLNDVKVWFATGMGKPGPAKGDSSITDLYVEHKVWTQNERFKHALDSAGVKYTYLAYDTGAHNFYHWQKDLQALAWKEIEDVFNSDIPIRPEKFTYMSMEPVFRIWDWQVITERNAVEFLQMKDVNMDGLTLTGSGNVKIITPPVYIPSRSYKVMIDGKPANNKKGVVYADQSGKLRFNVKLGASHKNQQFSLAQRAEEWFNQKYWQTSNVQISKN